MNYLMVLLISIPQTLIFSTFMGNMLNFGSLDTKAADLQDSCRLKFKKIMPPC